MLLERCVLWQRYLWICIYALKLSSLGFGSLSGWSLWFFIAVFLLFLLFLLVFFLFMLYFFESINEDVDPILKRVLGTNVITPFYSCSFKVVKAEQDVQVLQHILYTCNAMLNGSILGIGICVSIFSMLNRLLRSCSFLCRMTFPLIS